MSVFKRPEPLPDAARLAAERRVVPLRHRYQQLGWQAGYAAGRWTVYRALALAASDPETRLHCLERASACLEVAADLLNASILRGEESS